jgi:hypothetical protein
MGYTHYTNYIVIAEFCDYTTHTFYPDTRKDLECILNACVYNWCHNPNITWETGEPPKRKKLFKECMESKDFGEIATVFEFDKEKNCYFEWGSHDE